MASGIFRKSVEKIQFLLKTDNNDGYFTSNLCTFMIISRSVVLRIGNILDKSCRGNENTYIVCLVTLSANRCAYEIMWNNMVESYGPQITIHHDACALRAG